MDYEAILNEAHNAAAAAVALMGPEDTNALNCGFAWVKISGTDPLARFCRKTLKAAGSEAATPLTTRRRYGSNGEPGWQWWKPGGFNGQAVDHHIAGARAFVEVLGRYGIRADLGSRLD